jgi:hypothetical protein
MLVRLISVLTGLLLQCTASLAWIQVTPQIAETLGTWKLHDSTDPDVKNKIARLEVMPNLDGRDICSIRFSVKQPIFLSTSISQYVQGSTSQYSSSTIGGNTQLRWTTKKRSELVFCGVGLTVAGFDILSRNPRGSVRKIQWKLLNPHTLRVKYDHQIYLFGRTDASETSILVPLELWLLTQLLAGIYSRHVHLNI